MSSTNAIKVAGPARNNQFGFAAFRKSGDGDEVPDTGDQNNFGGPMVTENILCIISQQNYMIKTGSC